MTLTATNSTTGPITCTGGQTVYTFTFEADVEADVKAVHADANGVETEWTYTTHYTVDLSAKTVTYNDALGAVAAGDLVTVYRDTPRTQAIDFETYGPWDPQDHEDSFDKSMKVAQEAHDIASRSQVAKRTNPTVTPNMLIADGSITGNPMFFSIDLSSVAGWRRIHIDTSYVLERTAGSSLTNMYLYNSGSPMVTAGGGYYYGMRNRAATLVVEATTDTDWYIDVSKAGTTFETVHARFDVFSPDTIDEWHMIGDIEQLLVLGAPSLSFFSVPGYWGYQDTGAVVKPDELRFVSDTKYFASGYWRVTGIY